MIDTHATIVRAFQTRRADMVSALTMASVHNHLAASDTSHPEVERIALANARAADLAARWSTPPALEDMSFRQHRIVFVTAAEVLDLPIADVDQALEALS